MQRTYLTENDIKEKIIEVRSSLCIDYMPTKSEMISFYGNTVLSNAVTKHGGHRYFADLLGLKLKDSCSLTGDINENYIKELLEKQGYVVTKMPPRHPYDLLVNGVVRIDVKSANPIKSKVKGMNQFVFSINNQFPKCDLFVFVKIYHVRHKDIYIIPSNQIRQSQLGIGETSKYDCYKNRFDYIDKFIKMFEGVIV